MCPDNHAHNSVSELKILLVEDSYLAARSLADMLRQLGITVVGPAPSVDGALGLLANESVDAAILDINLGGRTVEPVATKLQEEGVPFFFVSGYNSPKLLASSHQLRRRLAKPVDFVTLRNAIEEDFLSHA